MATLRAPGGCPWDREQTMGSLRTYITEESYELVDAISKDEYGEICEECGDVLLQVVFIAQIASEKGYSPWMMCSDAYRQARPTAPHVFADIRAKDSADVLQNWEDIKTEKRKTRG